MGILIGLGLIFLLLVFILLVRISALVDILGKRQNKTLPAGNSLNGILLVLFYFGLMGGFAYLSTTMSEGYLPEASSEHGIKVDNLFWITTILMSAVFVIVNFFLFYFSFLYSGKEKKKAYFYSHNDKLELVWTIIPAIVLAVLVFYGWRVWSGIMSEPPENAVTMEIVGKQFNWIVRHPGTDGKLGAYNYRKIDAINQVGIDYTDKDAFDDFIPAEMHIPVGTPVALKIRARDVLHNVFLPHFRIKMDAVPGAVNTIWFTPTKTTKEMRNTSGNAEFNYEIVCNQICGRGHYGMRALLVVDSKEDYEKWLETQEAFLKKNPDMISDVPDELKDLAKLQLKDDKVALNQ